MNRVFLLLVPLAMACAPEAPGERSLDRDWDALPVSDIIVFTTIQDAIDSASSGDTVTIPAGTQSGHQFRLKSKGMSILRSRERGDMFVQALVETPVNLTKKQKELLKEFEKEAGSHKNNPESDSFFTKVKELWEDLKD